MEQLGKASGPTLRGNRTLAPENPRRSVDPALTCIIMYNSEEPPVPHTHTHTQTGILQRHQYLGHLGKVVERGVVS